MEAVGNLLVYCNPLCNETSKMTNIRPLFSLFSIFSNTILQMLKTILLTVEDKKRRRKRDITLLLKLVGTSTWTTVQTMNHLC